jgi:hypothetical protein
MWTSMSWISLQISASAPLPYPLKTLYIKCISLYSSIVNVKGIWLTLFHNEKQTAPAKHKNQIKNKSARAMIACSPHYRPIGRRLLTEL